MTRVHALLSKLLAVMLLIMVSTAATAVGLGEATLRSALTEPLDAEIRITNPEGLTAQELNVQLASPEDFRRAGVERLFFLSQLEFDVQPDGDAFVIQVTTSESVEEPFLDFLVELRWPSGRLVREYTLLLDPPVFAEGDSVMEQTFPASDPFPGQEAAEPAPELPAIEPPSQPQTTQPSAPQRRIEELPDSQYRVANNDTLWEIALRARQDPNQTPQQIMLAIQDMNPDAFINDNINRVKAGSLLNLPDADQVAVRSAADATREVARQNAALAGTPPATEAQIAATDDTASGLADGEAGRDPDGFLEVITEPGEPEAGAADGASETEVARLQNELAIQQELNDELRRQYDEQQSRLLDLEEQVNLLSRLMDLQSESAAQLQAAAEELERQEQAQREQEEAAVPAPGPDAPADDPTAPTDGDAPAAEAPMAQDSIAQLPDLDGPAVTTSPWALLDDLQAWIRQPMNAVLVLSGVLLILALISLVRRKKADAADADALDVDEGLMDDDPVADDPFDEGDDLSDDLLAEADPLPETAADGQSGAAAAEAVENAELYMAFQRYDEAETALKAALEQIPQDPFVQQKLLELYAETGNRPAFNELAEQFTGAPEVLDHLRHQFQSGGGDTLVGDDLSDDFDADDFDDLDLDLDLELDTDEATAEPARQSAAAELDDGVPELDDPLDDPNADADLSLDFDLDTLEEEPVAESASATTGSDDDLSLDFDLETDRRPAAGTADDSAALDSLELDEDLDFDFGDLETDLSGADDLKQPERDSFSGADDLGLDDDLETGGLEDKGSSDQRREDIDDLDDLGDLPDLEDPFAGEEDPTEDWGDLEESAPEAEMPEPEAFDQPEPETETLSESEPEPVTANADDDATGEWDDDFDFLAGTDEVATKLDLARAYIDMEDGDGARDILNEVLEEGDDSQKSAARKLLETL